MITWTPNPKRRSLDEERAIRARLDEVIRACGEAQNYAAHAAQMLSRDADDVVRVSIALARRTARELLDELVALEEVL